MQPRPQFLARLVLVEGATSPALRRSGNDVKWRRGKACVKTLDPSPPLVGRGQHLRQKFESMFAPRIDAALLKESFYAFFSALLDMVSSEACRDRKQRPCSGQIFVGHFQERIDAPRVRHTARCPGQARREARRRRPNKPVAMRRAYMGPRRNEVHVPPPAGRLCSNPATGR